MEDIVSEEVEKLASKKGFDRFEYQKSIILEDGSHYYPPITLSFLQKWLRENFHIYISVNPVIYNGDLVASYYYPTINNNTIDTRVRHNSYEGSLEYGIIIGLEKIKDK